MKKTYLLIVLCACLIGTTRAQTPEWKDVANILYDHCTVCHHPGGLGPMSLMCYSATLPWTPTIHSYIQTNTMPPWPPDTAYHAFIGQNVLTATEKAAIINWIDSGAVKGDTTLAPPEPTYSSAYKLKGTPDLVLRIPTFTSNASPGHDSYDCFALPTGLAVDRILRAFEIVPGNIAIVHHVIVTVDTSGTATSDTSGYCYSIPGSDQMVGGYAPGSAPTIFPGRAPLKVGMRIKAGSNLVLQIHYPDGTEGEKDSTQVRLYFYPIGTSGVRPIYSSTPLQNWSLNIPADSIRTFTAQYPTSGGLPVPLSMFAVFPHQHEVGVSLKVMADSGSDTIPLISIPQWSFHWQGFYTYPKLVKVPAGYTLFSTHTYDNTANNPNNPNSPPQNVYAGPNTTNEMLFDSFQWLLYQPGDDTINVAAMLANDTLLGQAPEPVLQHLQTTAYPNPFTQQVNIGYALTQPARVSVSIYDVYGKKIKVFVCGNQMPGYHQVTWNGKTLHGTALPTGVYFYTIVANHTRGNGTIILQAEKQ